MHALEFEIEYCEPIEVVRKFKSHNLVFLDSAQQLIGLSRYSFIAVDPFATIVSKNGRIIYNDNQFYANPFIFLQQQIKQYSIVTNNNLPPFQGGIAGYFGYDLCRHLEKQTYSTIDDFYFDDLAVGFYDLVIAFDHFAKKAWLISSGLPERNEVQRKKRALQRADDLRFILDSSDYTNTEISDIKIFPTSNVTKSQYMNNVTKVLEYIKNGDIYQANIAQRFSATYPYELAIFDLYLRLRERKPAPFSAYVNIKNNILLSASPERFLKLHKGIVETRPIKGTRKRDEDVKLDAKLANELTTSEKDRAENIMIVDLLRNDLSKVCSHNSVKVAKLCQLESYPTVHHLVSVINGQLNTYRDAIDLLSACFPGGSITGAPKIRAMEIIAELETHKRGPYCGSIGYIGFDGSMDSSIIIRTLAIKNNTICYHVGGGIVADSDPLDEYEETLIKGSALYSALTLS